jgi:hypothetical protein
MVLNADISVPIGNIQGSKKYGKKQELLIVCKLVYQIISFPFEFSMSIALINVYN